MEVALPPMLHECDTLVFCGGGARCVSFLGALAALEDSARELGEEPYARLTIVSGALMALYVTLSATRDAMRRATVAMESVMRPFDAGCLLRLASDYGLDDGAGLRRLACGALVVQPRTGRARYLR